jgi:hypothetical protein
LDEDRAECAELLEAYFEWRIKGGFQPEKGDEKAFDILRRLGEEAESIYTQHAEMINGPDT